MAKRALVSPLPDPSSRIRQRVSGSTANFVGICNAVACPSPFNSPDRSAQHGGCHHRPMPRHPSPACGKRAGHGSLGQNLHLLAVSPTAPETLCSTESRFQPNPQSRRISDRNNHPTPNRQPILPAIRESQAAARTRRCAKRPLIPSSSRDVAIWNHRKRPSAARLPRPSRDGSVPAPSSGMALPNRKTLTHVKPRTRTRSNLSLRGAQRRGNLD